MVICGKWEVISPWGLAVACPGSLKDLPPPSDLYMHFALWLWPFAWHGPREFFGFSLAPYFVRRFLYTRSPKIASRRNRLFCHYETHAISNYFCLEEPLHSWHIKNPCPYCDFGKVPPLLMWKSLFITRDWWDVSLVFRCGDHYFHPWLMGRVVGMYDYFIMGVAESSAVLVGERLEQFIFLKFHRQAMLGGPSWKEFELPNSFFLGRGWALPPPLHFSGIFLFRNMPSQTATYCVPGCALFLSFSISFLLCSSCLVWLSKRML